MSETYLDPRGPRFGAWLTTGVLAVVLLTSSSLLIAAQTAVFLVGAVGGLRRAPYGLLFKTFVRPRLGAPEELEAEAPPRFAQAVGAIFGVVGTAALLAGAETLGLVAVGLALAAALLNAAFGFCLGCEIYLIARRTLGRATPRRFVPPRETTPEGVTA